MDPEQITVQKDPLFVTDFRAGDLVVVDNWGEGIIVGFTSLTGNPEIYFYLWQKCVCVGVGEVKRK